ncbi:MAG: AAA family ATPase [Xanthobacteraceae bacterium]
MDAKLKMTTVPDAPRLAPESAILPLSFFSDFRTAQQRKPVLKGLLHCGETSAIVAPAKAGKSALVDDIAVHVASGRDWNGHHCPEPGAVLIIALERAALHQRRIAARADGLGLSDVPVAVSSSVVNMLDPAFPDLIATTVFAVEERTGLQVRLIVIDTATKGIAAGGGDEDRARDVNRAAANLRRLHERVDAHICLVWHSGKDVSKGARGSSALIGDLDVVIEVKGTQIRTASVAMANDQEPRDLINYELRPVVIGADEDGQPITTAIVVSADAPEPSGRSNLTRKNREAHRVLTEMLAEGDTVQRPDDPKVPADAECVLTEAWKDRLLARRILDGANADTASRQFRRIKSALVDAGVVGISGSVVWRVSN